MNNDSENILIICVIGLIVLAGIMFVCLFPNNPRIIVTKPNQPSIQSAKVEPVKGAASSIRRSLGIFEVSAYCQNECCCGEYADGITASGHKIKTGDKFCAADSMIPFGMKLDIPGYGIVPVLDRGGDIIGRKLDVFFPTHLEALIWGRQYLEIFCWVRE